MCHLKESPNRMPSITLFESARTRAQDCTDENPTTLEESADTPWGLGVSPQRTGNSTVCDHLLIHLRFLSVTIVIALRVWCFFARLS